MRNYMTAFRSKSRDSPDLGHSTCEQIEKIKEKCSAPDWMQEPTTSRLQGVCFTAHKQEVNSFHV